MPTSRAKPVRRIRRLALALVALPLLIPAAPAAVAGTAGQQQQRTVGETMPGAYLAASVAAREGDFDSAAWFFISAFVRDQEDPYLAERALILSLAAGNDLASAVAAAMVGLLPGHPLARITLAVEALAEGNSAAALSNLDVAATGDATGLIAAITGAWALAARGETDAALARLEAHTGPAWTESFINTHIGLIDDRAGRSAEALAPLRRAYDADPTDMRVAEAYVRALARSGDRSSANRVLAEVMRRTGGHRLLLPLAAAMVNPTAAVAPLVDSDAAGAAELFYSLADIVGFGDAEIAAAYFNLALTLDPNHVPALLSLAGIAAALGQQTIAITYYDQVPYDSPLRPFVDLGIGIGYAGLGDVDAAESTLGALLQTDPANAEAALALASVQRIDGRCEDSVATLTGGLTAAPTGFAAWEMHYNRAVCHEILGDWPSAEADLIDAISLAPDEPEPLNHLGYTWVDRNEHIEEGLALIERALAVAPDNAYMIDSLGWAHYRLGNYDLAVEQLERAVTLVPSHPVLTDHLGDAYWRVGRLIEARFQWAHARDLDPDPELLAIILDKLENGLPDLPAEEAVEPAPAEAAPAEEPAAAPPAEAAP